MKSWILRAAFAASLMNFGLTAPSHATSVMPQPWEAIVASADLIGVVECVVAGEFVARYRIIESWTGPPSGSEVTIRGAANVQGSTLPMVLCGERLLVAAWKWRPEYRLSSALGISVVSPGGGLPLWWRLQPADYFIPSSLHDVPLSLPPANWTVKHPLAPISDEHADLDSLRADAMRLLTLSEGDREAAVLRALIDWHIVKETPRAIDSTPDPESESRLTSKAHGGDVDTIVSALLEFATNNESHGGSRVFSVLATGGRGRTLSHLERLPEKPQGFSGSMLSALIEIIRRRVGLDPPEDYNPLALSARPSVVEMQVMRETMASAASARDEGGRIDYQSARANQKAFETLSYYDPEFVTQYLAEWANRGNYALGESEGYSMGSFFAWRCPRDRARYLRRLLGARDPYVRVAGAVYLCFENEEEGIRALRSLARLPGDPGAWAALNLARRGDKRAVTRALDVYRSTSGVTSEGRLHRSLQERLLILFSNSAKTSGVPQPGRWSRDMFNLEDDGDQLRVYGAYMGWWNAHAGRIRLSDLWLDQLKQQKID